VRVVAVYDHDPERARATAATFGSSLAEHAQDILEHPEIQAVIVASETAHHLELVTAAARAGKHVFCEKPLGLGAADARAMADAIKDSGVHFQTGFFFRTRPAHRFIAREIAAGNLGQITRVRYGHHHAGAVERWFDPWRWFTQPERSGGGALLDLGAHCLDLIVQTLTPREGEVIRAQAAFGNRVGHYGPDIDEYGVGTLEFASGVIAQLEASWVDAQGSAPAEVFGTEGFVRVAGDRVYYASKRVPGADGGEVTALPEAGRHPFELFWDVLLGRASSDELVPVEHAALGSALMERLYRAGGRETNGAG
jgi:predicted dehydrogenase